MEITGIRSRVLAKLSRYETVTADTIARICNALKCDVGDVMGCVDYEKLSLRSAYRKIGKTEEENEFYRKIVFFHHGQKYVIYETKVRATKATRIECRGDGTLYWVQFYPFGGISSPSREENFLLKPVRRKNEIVIVFIKGKPGLITGLDTGIFVSAHGSLKNDTDVYVMSESAFKLFAS